jgi:uncharacterized protein YbaA (DUF1428 family)
MPRYVDGFVIPIKRSQIARYRRIAAKAGKIWREYGALEYKECVGDDLGDDLAIKRMMPFPRLAKLRKDETVIFAWILYRSRAHRDRVNAKGMKDPRLTGMMDPEDPVFDHRRMTYGGFSVLVDL